MGRRSLETSFAPCPFGGDEAVASQAISPALGRERWRDGLRLLASLALVGLGRREQERQVPASLVAAHSSV